MPSQKFLDGNSDEALACVHGMAPLHRWKGNEIVGRSVISAPAPIIAYNMYMNAVDVMDQRHSTNATICKEKWLNMSIFTMVLDISIHNAYCLHEWLVHNASLDIVPVEYREFKQHVAEQLVQCGAGPCNNIAEKNTTNANTNRQHENLADKDFEEDNIADLSPTQQHIGQQCIERASNKYKALKRVRADNNCSNVSDLCMEDTSEDNDDKLFSDYATDQRNDNNQNTSVNNSSNEPLEQPTVNANNMETNICDSGPKENLETHMLLPTKNKQCLICHLCKMIDNIHQRKCGFCCIDCGLGYHVECFTAFHHQSHLEEKRSGLHKVIVDSEKKYRRKPRAQKNLSTIKDLTLPCL